MARRTRLEITLETSRLVIRCNTPRTPVWCVACSSPAQPVTPEEVAALAGVDTTTVYRWVEAEQLHFMETAEPYPLICLNSLHRSTHKGENSHATEKGIDHHNHD